MILVIGWQILLEVAWEHFSFYGKFSLSCGKNLKVSRGSSGTAVFIIGSLSEVRFFKVSVELAKSIWFKKAFAKITRRVFLTPV